MNRQRRMPPRSGGWPRWRELLLASFIAAGIGVQFLAPSVRADHLLGLTLAAFVGAVVSLGFAMKGQPLGVIVDNRNRLSLSKLQMLLWTLVVVSAIAAGASKMLARGAPNPLELGVPWELFAAMGIAAVSFVGAPTVLSVKLDQPTPETVVRDARSRDEALRHTGRVALRDPQYLAHFSDLFTGDEVVNADSPDLSKIQSFAITLLLVGVYLAALFAAFAAYFDPGAAAPSLADPARAQQILSQVARAAGAPGGVVPAAKAAMATSMPFPPLSPEFLWLMGVSHAAYLAYKAAPHGAAPGAAADPPEPRIHIVG